MCRQDSEIVPLGEAPLNQQARFACLGNDDVITAQVSDHHPVVHDGVLFWNVMMQCNTRGGGGGVGVSFNNGFGLIEEDLAYRARLTKVGHVIAEAVFRDPSIEVIGLCEGPIRPEHVAVLLQSLRQFPGMSRFVSGGEFHKPVAMGQNWGLLMLADTRYTVKRMKCDFIARYPRLTNRFQLWRLNSAAEEKYVALAHFPFAGDEHKVEKDTLSTAGAAYCGLINTLLEQSYKKNLVFCADFNFNPYLICQWRDRALDQITNHNSILLTVEIEGVVRKQTIKTVTVDGILLSPRAKQKYYITHPAPEVFTTLSSEYSLLLSQVKRMLADLVQRAHDLRFGIVPYYRSV